MSKSGFSTLNRWLGRKNKEKSMSNGKLSKSTTNLSVSSTNINETSQLEYNRITPLPAATTNAPFEQTFRITVLLPKDQLYVTRLGARVALSKLLELVCDNKLLDADKYEFRNPVDSSQVYSCDLTIGAVGLSEVRLCHKSESYDNFNADEIIKMHRTSLIRESLSSSSEFSSRNSKHTTKTTSPYSSTNSLNSMDSAGYARPGALTGKLPTTPQPKMAAPPRKKRAAPRPPSQMVIPEKSALIMENGGGQQNNRQPESPLTTKDFSVSTPNLTSSTMLLHSDINGNDCNGHTEDYNGSSGNGSLNSNGYNDDTVLYAQIQKKNALNLRSDSKPDLEVNEENGNFPEPSPRKKIVPVIKKKTTAPPAPPPRNSMYMEETESLVATPTTPKEFVDQQIQEEKEKEIPKLEEKMVDQNCNLPTPVPRITTTTLLNATDIESDLKSFETETENTKLKNGSNVSKVLLNRTPTPEPRSLSCEPPDMDACYETQIEHFKQQRQEDDCVSKQADSGIGEPVPSPIPDSHPLEVSTLDVKSNFESSSDDDDMVKVYNFKLGKTLVKPLNETKTLEELTLMNNEGLEETDSELGTPLTLTQAATPNTLSETSSWNFAIPISPPPNFADNKFVENMEAETKPDTPITPKIKERPILNFESLKQEEQDRGQKENTNTVKQEKRLVTPTTPLDSIVDELSSIIQEKGVESLIKKSDNQQEIESAKPNTLANFSINSITQNNVTKPKEVLQESTNVEQHSVSVTSSAGTSPSTTPDEDKLYRKRNSVTSLKQRRSVTRSDSFHTTALTAESSNLTKRTSSQLSLDQMNGNLNRRKSSSELSIGETPSLQSLEIMKTILNSRKNSLANSSGDETVEVNTRRPSEELKFASLELKTTKTMERAEKEKEEKELKAKQEKELKAQHEKELKVQQEKELQAQLEIEIKAQQEKEFKAQQEKELKSQKEKELKAQKDKEMKDLQERELKAQLEKELQAKQEELKQQQEQEYKAHQERELKAQQEQQQQQLKAEQDKSKDDLREEKSKELPKVYRYSGPPSINFSTWNERPKVQIQAIKNEGDYIFGGNSHNDNTNKTVPRNYRMSTPNTMQQFPEERLQPPPVAPKPAVIQRMGIPEKEFKVPILVKPIKDVVIETTTLPKEDQKSEVTSPKPLTNGDIVENKEKVFPKVQMNGDVKTSRPTVEHVLRPQTQTIINTSTTLPRSNKQRFSMPGPQLLRSSSITKDPDNRKSCIGDTESISAPFGQNTLRRTGFKEKMLAQEEKEKQKAIQINTQNQIIQNTPPVLSNGELKNQSQQTFINFSTSSNSNSITSAKLRLNINKKSSTFITNSNSSHTPATTTPINSTSFLNAALRPKIQTPKTAPAVVIAATTPPPPPALINVQLKPVTSVQAPLPANNPRDLLMDAIRNFNQDKLKEN